METLILKECGYEDALYGLGLSFGLTSDLTYGEFLRMITYIPSTIGNGGVSGEISLVEKLKSTSRNLYRWDGGHNKFLESIQVWLCVNAPRYWWSEADTYRVGVTKQSESTMHTIMKQPFKQEMFEEPIPQPILDELEKARLSKQFTYLKNILPEGFLQKRIWCVNYKVLRNILSQRKNHKLVQWKNFCQYIYNNVYHKEYFEDIMAERGSSGIPAGIVPRIIDK